MTSGARNSRAARRPRWVGALFRRELAVRLAPRAVAVLRALVAALAECRIDDAIAAVPGLLAGRGAAVRAVDGAVVAAEIAVLVFDVVDPVAAERTELTLRRAAVVQAVLIVAVTEVALFRGRGDAVAAPRLAHGARRRESGERELVVRLTRMPIGVEDYDLVGLPDLEPEVRHVAHRDLIPGSCEQVLRLDHPLRAGVGERDRALQALVRCAEVEHELAVDVHPNVVVTIEGQGLVPRVAEEVARLRGEVEVAHLALDGIDGAARGLCRRSTAVPTARIPLGADGRAGAGRAVRRQTGDPIRPDVAELGPRLAFEREEAAHEARDRADGRRRIDVGLLEEDIVEVVVDGAAVAAAELELVGRPDQRLELERARHLRAHVRVVEPLLEGVRARDHRHLGDDPGALAAVTLDDALLDAGRAARGDSG